MYCVNPSRCLTRVLVDDDGVELAELPAVMQRIQGSLRSIPDEQREYVANALLNLAVARMGARGGRSANELDAQKEAVSR